MALLAGCGGSGKTQASFVGTPTPTPTPGTPPPSPTPTPTASPNPTPTPTPLAASRFIYAIIDFEADGFFGGSINSTTGAVSLIPGSPFNDELGQNIVLQVLSDPQGRFLYSLNLGASSFGVQFGQIGIGAYTINQSSGVISPSGQVIFPSVRDAELTIDASGHFLYQPDSGTIDSYSIDQSTGALTLLPAQPAAVPVGNFSAASPDGRFILNEGNGLVEAFSVNTATGQLTLTGPPIPTGGSGGPMTISSDSRFIYVANTTESNVAVFNIGPAGVLAPTLGSPFMVDPQSAGITLSPDGRFLYMAFGSPDTGHVKGWAVNPDTGNFSPIAGASLSNANTINVDHSGLFAYVSQQKLVTYKVDPTTGALTQVSQTPQPWSDLPDNVALIP
jgi:6-phosphogluconolactonase (cycloisomerase 2 family)